MIGFWGWMGPETTGFLGIPSDFNWKTGSLQVALKISNLPASLRLQCTQTRWLFLHLVFLTMLKVLSR